MNKKIGSDILLAIALLVWLLQAYVIMYLDSVPRTAVVIINSILFIIIFVLKMAGDV